MKTSDIFSACKLLEQAIEEKGYTHPECDFRINWFGEDFRLKIEYRAPGAYTSETQYFNCNEGEEIEPLFDQANEHVQNLVDPEEAKRADFMKQLGRVIDRGRQLGIDEYTDNHQDVSGNVLEQLESIMKTLSENILTDQSSNELL